MTTKEYIEEINWLKGELIKQRKKINKARKDRDYAWYFVIAIFLLGALGYL